MEYNSHLWAGASKTSLEFLDRIQNHAMKVINDDSVSVLLSPLSHRRNVGSIVLFYRYYFGMCAQEIKDLLPPFQLFSRSTRLSERSHPFTIEQTLQRTSHYKFNSFFSRCAKLWNRLPCYVFPLTPSVTEFKRNVNKFLLLSPNPN